MVSFWPFKGSDTSAASFEKVLSQLSTKINKTSAQNDGFRQKQRRYKALWTIYSSFAYILVVLILVFVTGWDKWGAAEYSAIAGSPVLVYGVRSALDAYYNYRIANSQSHLNDLVKQREAAIEKLKTATKYNSTQQLLDKYGGTPPKKRQPSPQPAGKRRSQGGQSNQGTPQGQRTGFAPPPTANIPGRQPPQLPPMTPEGTPGSVPRPVSQPGAGMLQLPESPDMVGEDFAPNAFGASARTAPVRQPSSQYATDGPKWYDRILDVVLGEDETAAKNRIALICQNCRLVNGQAPPGTRTLEEVGKWRCSSCQAWNGVESEHKKMLKQLSGDPISPASPSMPMSAVTDPEPVTASAEENDEGYEHVDGEVGDDEDMAEPSADDAEDATPARSTRSKARQRKKT